MQQHPKLDQSTIQTPKLPHACDKRKRSKIKIGYFGQSHIVAHYNVNLLYVSTS